MRVELYRDGSGRYRWRCKAANHRTTAASEQGYRWKAYAKLKARRAFPGVPLVDRT